MRSFIKSCSIIFICFVLVIISLEIVFYNPQNIIENMVEGYKKEKNVSVLLIGNSHTKALGSPKVGSKKSYNLGVGGQDIFHMYALISATISDSISHVVLGIDYDMLGYNYEVAQTKWLDRLYNEPTGIMYDNSFKNKMLSNSNFFLANRNLNNVIWYNPSLLKKEESRINQFIDNSSSCKKRAMEHSKHKFREHLILENVEYINKIVALSLEHNCHVLIINFPKRSCYYDNYNSEVISMGKAKLEEIDTANKNVNFIDFWRSPLFSNRNFIDNDHLNEKGTQKLIEQLKLKESFKK